LNLEIKTDYWFQALEFVLLKFHINWATLKCNKLPFHFFRICTNVVTYLRVQYPRGIISKIHSLSPKTYFQFTQTCGESFPTYSSVPKLYILYNASALNLKRLFQNTPVKIWLIISQMVSLQIWKFSEKFRSYLPAFSIVLWRISFLALLSYCPSMPVIYTIRFPNFSSFFVH